MKQSKIQNIVAGIGIIIFLSWIATTFLKNRKLEKEGQVTTAYLYDWYISPKGGISLKFQIKINGITYKSSSVTRVFRDGVYNDLTHKYYPAIYLPSDPNTSDILLTPEDFKAHNLKFPDSQKWIQQYLK